VPIVLAVIYVIPSTPQHSYITPSSLDDDSSESGESDHDTSTYDGQTQQNDTGEEIRPRRTRTLMTAPQLAILYDLLAQVCHSLLSYCSYQKPEAI
jgi:hypothetical protein